MAILCEVTCNTCAAVVDPRQVPFQAVRKYVGGVVDGITSFEEKSVVVHTQWTFASPCPVCGAVSWSITGVTHDWKDKR